MTCVPPTCSTRTAIVVGGTVGFGAGITRELHRCGFSVATVGRTAEPPPEAWAHFPCDLANATAWMMTVESLLEATGSTRVDVLIYAVGYARVFPFGCTPPEEWERHFRLNVTYVAESFPRMETVLSENAYVATTGSQWSFRHGWPDLIPYITAKHALAALTEEYAVAFPQRRFRHYCVPTMATHGYEAVRRSVIDNKAQLHNLSNPQKPADPGVIGRLVVSHLLSSDTVGPVLFEINTEGTVSPVVAP